LCSSKIFYPQSFLIYDGGPDLINEQTTPAPLSVYGRYKLEAEEILLKDSSDHLIIRMGGMFGGYEKDKNFIGKFSRHISGLIKKNIKSQNVGDRIWQPTYTKDLAYNSLVLISEGKKGVYNMASHGEASFFDIAEEIVKYFDLGIIINKISNKDFVEKAKRPERAVLSNSKLESEGVDLQRDWKTGLLDYLDSDYFRRLFS
jgi:dTDP-4-dehydrorhamnose reductase